MCRGRVKKRILGEQRKGEGEGGRTHVCREGGRRKFWEAGWGGDREKEGGGREGEEIKTGGKGREEEGSGKGRGGGGGGG